MLRRIWNDEAGIIITAEICLILTITVLGVVVGLSEVAVAVNTELNDFSNAIGALDQSFFFAGVSVVGHRCKGAFFSGSRFRDGVDDCDRNDSCDVVCGIPPRPTRG